MPRFILFILLLLAFKMGHGQYAGKWIGAGEYLPGLPVTAVMKKMAAEKKLVCNIAADGTVSGSLTTIYNSLKAVIPNEAGDQLFALAGKYDAAKASLLLIVTHFRSKPDSSESYLTFSNPDSVYYDLSVSRQNDKTVVTAVINKILNRNTTAEWVGSFRGGGLDRNVYNNAAMHFLPLRIRFDNTPISLPADDVPRTLFPDTAASVRFTQIQRTITLDTSFVKLELYDNGEIDSDIASLLLDGKTILNKQLLGPQAVTLYINLSRSSSSHTLELFANNLGSIPPNTALLILTCKKKRYEIHLSSDETVNGSVKLVFDPD